MMIVSPNLLSSFSGKNGYRSLALGVLVLGFAACQSAPPPPPPPPPPPMPVLRFSVQNFKDAVELNIEGARETPKMTVAINLIDVPEAPESPDAELRNALRGFLRKSFYNNQEPDVYAKALIENYRTQYLAQTETVKANPTMPMASMNWEYTETVEAPPSPQGSKYRVFSRSRYEFTGGAHGETTKIYAVAGDTGPEQLQLDYFVKDGVNSAPLNALIVEELRRFKGLAANTPLKQGGFFENTVPTPANFFVNADGIGFHWDAYEIAPYAAGAFEVVVPYSRLQELLTPQGAGLIEEPPAPVAAAAGE